MAAQNELNRSPSCERTSPPSSRRIAGSLSGSYDWPLSRNEKKQLLVRADAMAKQMDLIDTQSRLDDCQGKLQRLELEAIESRSLPSSGTSTPKPWQSPCTQYSDLQPKRLSLGSSASTMSNTTYDENVHGNLEKMQKDMQLQQQRHNEEMRLMRQQVQALLELQQQQMQMLMQPKMEANREDENSMTDESKPVERNARSCPARTGTPPRSALKGRRDSRGGTAPCVRFVEDDNATSSDDECLQNVASASTRGRLTSRRVSRGPDGRPVPIRSEDPKAKQAAGDGEDGASAAGGYGKTAAGGVAGGLAGLGVGAFSGAMAGLPAALFTFGLSVPLGAVVGGGFGASAGVVAGSVVGSKIGAGTTSDNVADAEDEDTA